MPAFYENRRDENSWIHTKRNGDHTFPSHFHRNIEIFVVKRGQYTIVINGKPHSVGGGDTVFIDCYDVHSYERISEIGDDCVIIIPYDIAASFNRMRGSGRPRESVISSPALADKLIMLADSFLPDDESGYVGEECARLILSLLYEAMEFDEGDCRDDTSLVQAILRYLQAHYRERITRSDISRALGYSEAYVSRVFNEYLGHSISEHISSLRLEYIDYQRAQKSAPTLTELIYKSGFGSEQSYYRARKRRKGATD